MKEEEGLYYPGSENKGADQLRGHREADLRLCFRICRLLVFPCGGSFITYLVTFYRIILITHTTYSFFPCVTSEQHKKIFGNCVTHRIHKASDNIHDKYSTVLFFNFQIPAVIN